MSKKKSITIYSIIAVILVVASVFSLITFECGGNGVYDYSGFIHNIKLGLDLSGGVYSVFNVNEPDDAADLDSRIDGTVKSLEKILFDNGYSEAVVSTSNKKIRVEVPDVEDTEEVFKLIGRPASLHITSSNKFKKSEILVSGKDLVKANVIPSPDNDGKYAVAIRFNDEGAKKFAKATQTYKGKQIYIWINGANPMPVTVKSVIADGKASITGHYDYDQAHNLAIQIQAGSFGVKMDLAECRVISPTLGENAIQSGLIAGGVSLGLILIFMACVYGMFGVLADVALLIYTVLLIIMLSIIPAVQLTLPGIAGIIIGIGMAVDANIIIFERIKDEYRNGRTIPTAIKNGFKRATAAVLDGNATTLIGAIVLYIFGASSIKGFAITLIISLIISMFTALIITRLLIKLAMPFNSTNPKPYKLKRKEGIVNEEA